MAKDVRDELSNLVIEPYNKEFIEKYYKENGHSIPDAYVAEIKENRLLNPEVHYNVCCKRIACYPKAIFSKCGKHYDDFKDALEAWVDIQVNEEGKTLEEAVNMFKELTGDNS